MNLGKKTFIFIASIVGFAVLGVFIASQTVLLNGFEAVEKKEAERNGIRLSQGVNNLIERINTLVGDWSHWNDAYEFVSDGNQDFIDNNFQDTTFITSNLNLIVFVDNEGRIVHGKAFDLVLEKEVPLQSSILLNIKRESVLITHPGQEHVTGLLDLDEGIMMVSSHPIFDSNGQGPSHGTLIMGSLIGELEIEKITQFVGFPVTVQKTVDAKYKDKTVVEVVSNDEISVFEPLLDVHGNQIAVGKAVMTREVVVQGKTALYYFLFAVVLIGLILMVGGVYFQNRMVLDPILKLAESVNKIRNTGNLSQRVQIIGNDEISRLSSDINAMFISLEKFNQEALEDEVALKEKITFIEKQNTDLEQTKSAILNILEDEKELEENMKREHDRLDLIISSMGEGLLTIGNDYKITMINPVAQKLLGVTAKFAVGKKWSEIIITLKSSRETPTVERSFSKAIAQGKTIITPLESDHYYKTRSGKSFPVVSITAPLKISGKVVGAVKVFRDATSEKHAKEIIEKKVVERTHELSVANTKITRGILDVEFEKARLTASINSLNVGFIIADIKNKIIIKNPAVSEILRIENKDISIKKIAGELGGDVSFEKLCLECVRGKDAFGRDDIIFKDKFLRLYLTPVIVGSKVIGYVILFEDVTAQKQLERSKDEFFAVASHELRTPLTAIRGNTSLIMDYYAEKIKDKDLKEMIGDMHESSVRLINIVNDFLDASRLEQGRVEFKKDTVDMGEVTKGVVDELAGFIKERGLSLKFEPPKSRVLVMGDRDRMWQIIHNLVANCAKYTKAGGGEVTIVKDGSTAKLSITDTGVGISPANQRLLFKKFQQAGERVLARDVTKGTGMGLYISKLLAEGMGGAIYLEKSELGRGSTFVFELPMNK